MDEYIEREKAIDAVLSCFGVEDSIFSDATVMAIGYKLKDIPSADVQPVKHGRWVGRELGHCTCCGHHGCASDIWNGCGDIYYCPNCGATMDGEA